MVHLENLSSVTDFYPVSMAAFVDMSRWTAPVRKRREKQGKISGYVAVKQNDSDAHTLHCEFYHNKRVLAQVVCRHLGYRMGVIKATAVSHFRIT